MIKVPFLTDQVHIGLQLTLSTSGLFTYADATTCDHNKRCVKPQGYTAFGQNSFCVRVIEKWNKLPEEIVNAVSVLQFKNLKDIFMVDKKYCKEDSY